MKLFKDYSEKVKENPDKTLTKQWGAGGLFTFICHTSIPLLDIWEQKCAWCFTAT